jgi:predicted TIM-barrel fold metal-dependent hydrolase
MIVDAHIHLGDGLFGRSYTAEQALAGMDAAGIDRAVVMPLKPREYQYPPANDATAIAVHAAGGRLAGFGRVDPWQGEAAVDEARRCLDALGMVGLFLHPWEELFAVNAPFLAPIIDVAEQRGRPVMLAGGFPTVSHPARIADLARRHPRAHFIATSGGQINISGGMLSQAEAMLRASPNVLMETSGVYREDFIEDMTAAIGAERLVFGSGAPVFEPRYEVLRVRRAHLSETERAQIGGTNLLRLLNWG